MLKKSADKMINIPKKKRTWKNISQITEQFIWKRGKIISLQNVGLKSRKIKFQNNKKLQVVLKEEKSKKQPNKGHNVIWNI